MSLNSILIITIATFAIFSCTMGLKPIKGKSKLEHNSEHLRHSGLTDNMNLLFKQNIYTPANNRRKTIIISNSQLYHVFYSAFEDGSRSTENSKNIYDSLYQNVACGKVLIVDSLVEKLLIDNLIYDVTDCHYVKKKYYNNLINKYFIYTNNMYSWWNNTATEHHCLISNLIDYGLMFYLVDYSFIMISKKPKRNSMYLWNAF